MLLLSKAEILRGENQIDRLYKSGKRISTPPLLIIKTETEKTDEHPVKAAFVIPKRNFRKATQRNRLRRQLKEAWRLNKQPLIDVMKVKNKTLQLLLIYSGKTPVSFSELEQKIVILLHRLIREHA
ncbi:MAG: ribonuclease P protein component [Bacteroidia bacterium]|nr:ribonuclease P protein component [Bacteroidia bacterium]